MAGKYNTKSTNNSQGYSTPSSLNADTIREEFSRLSDVQEEFYFYSPPQQEGESNETYNARINARDIVNESINDVKRNMLKIIREYEGDSNQNKINKYFNDYKTMEEIAVDNINEYFSILKSLGANTPEPYQSIAFYADEGLAPQRF